jgi:hypothetical protein
MSDTGPVACGWQPGSRAGSAECTGAGRTPAGCTVATTVTSPMHRSAAHLVEVVLRVRRFFCDIPGCPAESFAEPVPGLMTSGARRTGLLKVILEAIGWALAGRAGARLAAMVATGATDVRPLGRWANDGLPRYQSRA